MRKWSSRSAWCRCSRVAEVLDPLEALGAGAADHAVDFVALAEQKLGQVGAILAGDAGDQCASRHARLSAESSAA